MLSHALPFVGINAWGKDARIMAIYDWPESSFIVYDLHQNSVAHFITSLGYWGYMSMYPWAVELSKVSSTGFHRPQTNHYTGFFGRR